MYTDDAVDLLEEMPANVVRDVLSHVSPEARKEMNQLLQYPDDSAGAVMTTEFRQAQRRHVRVGCHSLDSGAWRRSRRCVYLLCDRKEAETDRCDHGAGNASL